MNKTFSLSPKDISYLSDGYEWNKILLTKIDFYTIYCEDEETCKLLKKLKKCHNDICDKILQLLEDGEANG